MENREVYMSGVTAEIMRVTGIPEDDIAGILLIVPFKRDGKPTLAFFRDGPSRRDAVYLLEVAARKLRAELAGQQ